MEMLMALPSPGRGESMATARASIRPESEKERPNELVPCRCSLPFPVTAKTLPVHTE